MIRTTIELENGGSIEISEDLTEMRVTDAEGDEAVLGDLLPAERHKLVHILMDE